MVTTLFSPCDLKRKPAFTLEELLEHCNAGESQYCWWAERDMGTPSVDFSRFYGPAESQSGPGWLFGLIKQECPYGGWLFAAVGVVEGVYNWKTGGKPVQFSKQEMLDCVYWNDGCKNGGDSLQGLEVIQEKGILESKDYEYKYEKQFCECRPVSIFSKIFGSERPRVYCQNAFDIRTVDPHSNANATMELLKKYGPMSVAVRVGEDFKNYQSGFLTKSMVQESLSNPNHEVVLVGYGETWFSVKPYWIIRNSYGPDWGYNGLAYLEQSEDGFEVNRQAHYIVWH
ncbi:hypothetical protein TYRP_023514 [Tyrophagus putrescentiae]|nr:hypothetical protein TYRP_023514 [Tyrophagus putrescentiae]